MTSPGYDTALFGLPSLRQPGAALATAARDHLAYLREAGALSEGHTLQAAIVTELAGALAEPGKGYGKAQLAQALGQALDRLPTVTDSDAWDTWSTLTRAMATPAAPPAPPRYATRPKPGAAHEANAVALVAAMLGKPLMPWQFQVVRVATERTSDGRRYRYRYVVVTVPRQSGKTTLLDAVFVHRVLTSTRRIWMTAQSGLAATSRWNDLRKLVMGCKQLAPFVEERKSTGSSSLMFPRTGSYINPFATAERIHGETMEDAAVDEAFAYSLAEAADLLGAIKPAQLTIPDSQTWVTSTAGNADSTWLRSLVEHGRAHANTPGTDTAYFEWSGEQTDDPDDPAGYSFHPALGHTITLADLMDAAASVPPSERERAYRNRWVDSINEPLVPLTELAACTADDQAPPPADGSTRVAIGFDVDYDAGHAAIYAAWQPEGQSLQGRQLAAGGGMGWLADELVDVLAAMPHAQLVTPPDGPSLEIVTHLKTLGVDVDVLDAQGWALACGSLHRRIRSHTIALGAAATDTELAQAVAGAATRPLGDAWAISRKRSTAPVSSWGALAAAAGVIAADGPQTFPLIEGPQE